MTGDLVSALMGQGFGDTRKIVGRRSADSSKSQLPTRATDSNSIQDTQPRDFTPSSQDDRELLRPPIESLASPGFSAGRACRAGEPSVAVQDLAVHAVSAPIATPPAHLPARSSHLGTDTGGA